MFRTEQKRKGPIYASIFVPFDSSDPRSRVTAECSVRNIEMTMGLCEKMFRTEQFTWSLNHLGSRSKGSFSLRPGFPAQIALWQQWRRQERIHRTEPPSLALKHHYPMTVPPTSS